MVRDQLLNFIYNGFLEPVVGPALHQVTLSCVNNQFFNSLLIIKRILPRAMLKNVFILNRSVEAFFSKDQEFHAL